MLHFTSPNTSSTTSSSPKTLEENMQNVLKSTEDIINDDFEKLKIWDSPYQDFSWSPHTSSPVVYASSHERRPFEPANQYPRYQHPNLTSRFSPTQNSPQEITPFVINDNKDLQCSNRTQGESKAVRSLAEFMRHLGGNPSSNPVLKLSVVGQSQYVLEEKDIMNLFSPFGRILNILITKPRTAYVVLYDTNSALSAQKSLNKRYLKEFNVNLYVNFCLNIEEDIATFDEKVNLSHLQLQRYQVSNGSDKENACLPKNAKRTVFTFNQEAQFLPNFTAKFTCKYEVQIQNEKEFRVAQKIIGSRGYNMKKIIEVCQSQVRNQNITSKADFLKLRLRGKGSGFKEGPDQKESEEPIHLCVSSRYSDVFETACRLVEELLSYVYREYETFCKASGKKGNFPLQIKKSETYCGSNGDKQAADNAISTITATSPYDFGSFQFANENINTLNSQDSCFSSYASKPSPKNGLGPINPRRQFGQQRMLNCVNEVSPHQNFSTFNEIQASYIKYN